jgi:hypothetical protein
VRRRLARRRLHLDQNVDVSRNLPTRSRRTLSILTAGSGRVAWSPNNLRSPLSGCSRRVRRIARRRPLRAGITRGRLSPLRIFHWRKLGLRTARGFSRTETASNSAPVGHTRVSRSLTLRSVSQVTTSRVMTRQPTWLPIVRRSAKRTARPVSSADHIASFASAARDCRVRAAGCAANSS